MSFDIDVTKRIGEATVAARFTGGQGLTVLFGPSGAGKTSILNMAAGLLRPDAGHIRIGGTALYDAAGGIDLPPEQRRAGYVFQDSRLFPHRRVRDNLVYGQRFAAADSRWIEVEDVARLLQIGDLLDRWPRTLSGGEARRVAIGRALLSGPRFLLLDEPLSFLDRDRREGILQIVERIRDELRLPILYVTHDEREVERLANTVIRVG